MKKNWEENERGKPNVRKMRMSAKWKENEKGYLFVGIWRPN